MAGVISVGGLATGLNTNDIVSKLVALERRPLDLLGQEIADRQATKSSLATLQSKFAALQTAARALGTAGNVLVRTASSSDASVAGAAAGLGADRGSTTLTVTQLARGSVAGATVGLSDPSLAVATGPGTFQFQVGSGTVQSVALDGATTLAGLAASINGLAAGVTASAINLGTSASPDYRLQLVSQTTGSASSIAIVHDDTNLAVQTSQTGLDAAFAVSGFAGTFHRDANTVSDVLAGVTLSLKNLGTTTIAVNDDADAITAKAKTLASAFDDLVTFVTGESQVSETRDKTQVQVGTLATDSTVRRLVGRAHEILSQAGTGSVVNLSSIGFATQEDGTISFDEAKFRAGLATNANGLAQLFAGDGTSRGIANDLSTFITDVTGAGGALGIHNQGLTSEIRSLQDQIDAGQRHVDAFQANLQAQFNALESFVSQIQSQGSFLQSALGSSSTPKTA